MRLDTTFKHRSIWLGFSMLVIMLYHSGISNAPFPFSLIGQYGYAGVDVFIFASGIGCYYSLERNPDLLGFLKRRLRRLGPVYLCFIIPWMIWRAFTGDFSIGAVIGNLLGIESFLSWEYHFNWYISALIPIYILIPCMKRLTDSCKSLTADFLAAFFFFAVCLPAWRTHCWNMVIWSRLPVLYLGVMYGKLGKQGTLLTKRCILLHGLAAGVGGIVLYCVNGAAMDLLWFKGFYWYPFLFIVPGVCLCLSAMGELLLRSSVLKPLHLLLQKAGTYSFELYLIHIFLFEQLVPEVAYRFPGFPHRLLWLMAWCAVVPLCILLNRAAALLVLPTKKSNTANSR